MVRIRGSLTIRRTIHDTRAAYFFAGVLTLISLSTLAFGALTLGACSDTTEPIVASAVWSISGDGVVPGSEDEGVVVITATVAGLDPVTFAINVVAAAAQTQRVVDAPMWVRVVPSRNVRRV